MVGNAVADQGLGKVVEACQVHGAVLHFNDIQVIKQQHAIFHPGFHAKCQGFAGSVDVDDRAVKVFFEEFPESTAQGFPTGDYPLDLHLYLAPCY